jgi:hypothetical protein
MSATSFVIKCRAKNCRETVKASAAGSKISAPAGWLSDRAPRHEGETVAGTCPDHSETIRIV